MLRNLTLKFGQNTVQKQVSNGMGASSLEVL